MIYCDTSLLIAALTPEAKSPVVQQWLAAKSGEGLAISLWVDTEFASAIAMKGRIGDLDANGRAHVLAAWRALRNSFHVEPIQDRHFRSAGDLLGRAGMRLRGGDALHLAIVHDRGFRLATLDNDLMAAAVAVAVKTVDPLGLT